MSESFGDSTGATEQGTAVQVQMRIERLYIKDASFESPGAPGVFTEDIRPKMQVDINTTAKNLGDNRHEVVLHVTVAAEKEDGKMAYVVEVQQAGVFVIEGVGDGPRRQVLGVICPNTLFPYLREALDALVTRGGFPPIMLAPVNFDVLFAQAMQQQAQQQAQQNQQNPPTAH